MKVVSNMKESLVKDNTGQGVRPAGKSPIRFGTVNVGTISGRANEIAEMLTRRKVDLCCLQFAGNKVERRISSSNQREEYQLQVLLVWGSVRFWRCWDNVSSKMDQQCYFCEKI